MDVIKNFKILILFLLVITFINPKVEAADECFEGVSRSIFKFNMAFVKQLESLIVKRLSFLLHRYRLGKIHHMDKAN